MRDGSVTDRACAACGGPLPDADPRRRCSGACRMAAHRRRRTAGTSAPGPGSAAPSGRVYECPACGERHLDERRCPECNLFCRALGPGGECPGCGEVVLAAELVAESAVAADARPTPAASPSARPPPRAGGALPRGTPRCSLNLTDGSELHHVPGRN